MMDDLSEQIDEIEALVSIYGKDWQTDDEENRIYSIEVGSDNKVAKLYIKLPKNYPSTASPSYEMSAPHLNLAQKNRLTYLMDEVCVTNFGQNVIFQLVEKVREELESGLNIPQESEVEDQSGTGECDSVLVTKLDSDDEFECPDIVHGEVIVDRKSSFQGHAAVVVSTKQVKQVLHMLYENKKIKQATHNMYAYRISRDGISNFIQDCEDDGESQAGGRLLHLLQIMEAKDVMVVVSRWYGGVHLGPDRFRHINNAARQVLTAGNFLPDKTKKKL